MNPAHLGNPDYIAHTGTVQTAERRWFSVLGPVRARVGDREINLGPPQQRATLAVLLLNTGRVVEAQHLIDALWGEAPPASAGQSIRTYISRLRRILASEDSLIVSSSGGYRMTLTPEELDLARFRQYLRRADMARQAPNLAGAAEALRQGLGLWQGQPLAGLPGQYIQAQRQALEALRLDARAALLRHEVDHPDNETAAGHGSSGTVTTELTELVAEHPLDERFRQLLMLSLYRSGRQGAALKTYEDARRLLDQELGVQPGPGMQDLHVRILRADLGLLITSPDRRDPGTGATKPAGSGRERVPAPYQGGHGLPAQLSADLMGFTGRVTELARLDGLLEERSGSALALALIYGMPGTGKTSLAVHWGHRVAHRFPDGQIQLNLRGFDASGAAMTPPEAFRRMFDALGVSPRQIPVEVDAQSVLLRSVLAGRRLLIVLDNARDAEQVRPLLPGAGGCLVIVTSRNQLPSLVARDHARPLALDVMPPAQAREFLLQQIGSESPSGSPGKPGGHDELDSMAALCGGLPLALSIVVSRVMLAPQLSLADVVEQLRADEGTLEAFSDEDTAMDLRSLFSWSYLQLDPEAARLLRVLAQHPGPDTAIEVAADMAGLPVRRIRALAGELIRAHLVREQPLGRFVLHDLVRAYAVERSALDDSPATRSAVLERMLDHYLGWAQEAARILRPQWQPVEAAIPGLPDVVVDLANEDQARDWLIGERHALVSVITIAAAAGLHDRVWHLTAAVTDLMRRYGYWQSVVVIHTQALRAGERLNEVRVQARSWHVLGQAHSRLNRPEDAWAALDRALELYLGLDDAGGQSGVHSARAFVHAGHGDYQSAMNSSRQAWEASLRSGKKIIIASAQNDYGWCLALAGEYELALETCREALVLCQELDTIDGLASTWDSLGFIHARLNDPRQAARCYEEAERRFREVGDQYNEGQSLVHLGSCYHDSGRFGEARATWQRALAILANLGDGAGQQEVHEMLNDLPDDQATISEQM